MTSIASPADASLSATGELLVDRMEEAARARLHRRWKVALACTLAGLLGGLLVMLLRKSPYEASARIQMFLRSAPANRQGRLGKGGMADTRELMMGRSFQGDVFDRLSEQDRALLVRGSKIRPGKHAAQMHAAAAANALGGLAVEVDPKTQMMTLSFSNQNPRLAAAVVSAAVATAEDMGLKMRMEQTARVSDALKDRLDDLQRTILEAEKKEDEAQQRLGVARVSMAGSSPGLKTGTAYLRPRDRHALKVARREGKLPIGSTTQATDAFAPEADPRLVALGAAVTQARLVERLDAKRAEIFASMQSHGQEDLLESQAAGENRRVLDELRLRLTDELAAAGKLAGSLGTNSPQMRAAQTQVDAAEREIAEEDVRLVRSAQTAAALAARRAAELSAAYAQRRREVGAQTEAEMADQFPEIGLEIDEALEDSQRTVLKGAQVNAALQSTGFYLVDAPSVPLTRDRPPYRTTLAVGLALGVMWGLLASLVLGLRERKRWTLGEAAAEAGLSVVAVLPRCHRAGGHAPAGHQDVLEVVHSPHSLYTSALEELREKITMLGSGGEAGFAAGGHRGGVIMMITSATPGEGKSTTAANLSVLLARTGARVLLIDADLHRPTLHRRFGLSAGQGLSVVLSGRATLEEAVQTTSDIPGLDILAAGPRPQFASQLLQSGRMEVLLREASAYRYIVVDAPPVLGSTDGPYLAVIANVLLFVARYGHVDMQRVRGSRRVLRPALPAFAGLIVNAIPLEG